MSRIAPRPRPLGRVFDARRRGNHAPDARERRGHVIVPEFVKPGARREILAWLETLRPIWEYRYSTERPPPRGESQRRLLRPVYWLGNWQFACLDYYRPPRGVHDRCVQAEPFPPVLARLVAEIERRIRAAFPPEHVPRGFRLNTCLVNFYGDRKEGERWVDSARVGEHRDFEPGPVASLSLGERALFQFVASRRVGERSPPALSQWLDDGALQLFAGPYYKERVFHRVQRVDRRDGCSLPPHLDDFRTRRVNFTFRYVPEEHVIPLAKLGERARGDVLPYVRELAERSEFFRRALAGVSGAT
ncbi:MAG TPA: alpha-ketoglutarate-dependent dioxygenase AlkB [Polyangiaceae bacterium]